MRFYDLRRRERLPELMDDPALEADRHYQALSGLTRLNRWSFTAGALWHRIRPHGHSSTNQMRILDVATGAGDIPVELWRRARKEGLELEIQGCDISDRAIQFARQRAVRCGAQVHFFQHDVLAHDLPNVYDAVTCSLFMHHLADGEAVTLLRRMRVASSQLALVSDLVRKRTAYWMAQMATHLLTRSSVVHTDGPLSVRAAFTCNEALALAKEAGWNSCSIARQWPCRFLLQWNGAPGPES